MGKPSHATARARVQGVAAAHIAPKLTITHPEQFALQIALAIAVATGANMASPAR